MHLADTKRHNPSAVSVPPGNSSGARIAPEATPDTSVALKKPWYRRTEVIAAAVILVLAALAIGIGIPLDRRNNREEEPRGKPSVAPISGDRGVPSQLGDEISREGEFGLHLASSGDGRIFAASGENGIQVYGYDKKQEDEWTQIGDNITITDSNSPSLSMSLDGEILAIGGEGSTSIYGYNSTDDKWISLGQVINMTYTNALYREELTVSLSADGLTLAIGAAGVARVYSYDSDDGWIQVGRDIDVPQEFMRYTASVSLSENGGIVAVGHAEIDSYRGHVAIFQFNEDWVQRGDAIEGEYIFTKSGVSVDLSANGNVVAIGASENSDNGDKAGQVRVFGYNEADGKWSQNGADISGAGDEDYFGISVRLSANGEALVVCSRNLQQQYFGRISVFDFVDGVWTQRGRRFGNGSVRYFEYDNSASISLDGYTVVYGGPEGISGYRVRVLEWDA